LLTFLNSIIGIRFPLAASSQQSAASRQHFAFSQC
jgi:hypothetical protein